LIPTPERRKEAKNKINKIKHQGISLLSLRVREVARDGRATIKKIAWSSAEELAAQVEKKKN
jgi:hypothetical protein